MTDNTQRQAGVLLASLALCAAIGCSREPGQIRPNVILIVLDTLRADHLGCYGYERNTSPRIDALAAGATLYKRAVASSPWTVPSHASLFTGLHSFEHGARTYKVEEGSVNNANALDLAHVTLAEVFVGEGYATGAFVSNVAYLNKWWQFDQGFQTYVVEDLDSKALNELVFRWMEGITDKPFFLFINYCDTHYKYNLAPRPGLIDEPIEQNQEKLIGLLRDLILPGGGNRPEELIRQLVNQYDTSIANVDEQIGNLLDTLERKGLYDETVVVVTSDHGEFLGEHELLGHSKDVYEEVLRVPLIIKGFHQEGGHVEEQAVSSVDLPRLILAELPPETVERYEGTFPYRPGNHLVIGENYYTRAKDLFEPRWGHRFNRIRTAVYDWPYKYIHSSDGNHELYDLANDPHETSNIITTHTDVVRELAAGLARIKKREGSEDIDLEIPTLPPEAIEKLEALGYVGD